VTRRDLARLANGFAERSGLLAQRLRATFRHEMDRAFPASKYRQTPSLVLVGAIVCFSIISCVWFENMWLWVPLADPTVASDYCPYPDGSRMARYVLNVGVEQDYLAGLAWLLLVSASAVSYFRETYGRRLTEISLALSTFAVGWAAATWLGPIYKGEKALRLTVGCVTSASEIFGVMDLFTYLRALLPLTTATVVLVALRATEEARHPLDLRPRDSGRWWRWTIAAVAWMLAVPAYVFIWFGTSALTQSHAVVTIWILGLPVTIMNIISVLSLVPRPGLRRMGMAAVGAAIALAFAALTNFWLLEHSYRTVETPPGVIRIENIFTTRLGLASTLTAAQQSTLDAADNYFSFSFIAMIWIGALSIMIRLALMRRRKTD